MLDRAFRGARPIRRYRPVVVDGARCQATDRDGGGLFFTDTRERGFAHDGWACQPGVAGVFEVVGGCLVLGVDFCFQGPPDGRDRGDRLARGRDHRGGCECPEFQGRAGCRFARFVDRDHAERVFGAALKARNRR